MISNNLRIGGPVGKKSTGIIFEAALIHVPSVIETSVLLAMLTK